MRLAPKLQTVEVAVADEVVSAVVGVVSVAIDNQYCQNILHTLPLIQK